MTKTKVSCVGLTVLGLAYLLLWPVPIDPVAWSAQKNEGYVGQFKENKRLQALKFLDLRGESGPEDAAVGADGLIYVPTHSGKILKVNIETGSVTSFSDPGGRVLGIEFSDVGELYAADAYRGLLKIGSDGKVTVLANATSDGSPIRYANDLDIDRDGTVYFSDSSTKFGAKASGGTLPASLLDLIEHGLHGRILKYDPRSKKTTILMEGLSFANGVALSKDGSYLLVAETGTYRVLKHWVTGSKAGQTDILIENLPGFPDNINDNPDGTFWIGLVSPRSGVVDFLSSRPVIRKIIMRLPAAVRPKPQRYGFAMRFDGDGNVLDVLQGPKGSYAMVTGGIDVGEKRVLITSLTEKRLGYLEKP
ncbi:MAG: SMP-30/gluconolactonase/LRE family protein [Hyphomicrobiaceae bacterium]